MAPSFLFNFTDKSPNVTVTDIPQNVLSLNIPPEEQKNLCPYPIPKLDDIVKDIERSAYQVDKHKFVSDLFECGAIAISNQVDLAQKEKREERYLQIIKGYTPDLQRKLAEIFGKLYTLLVSVVYDNGRFNDNLGELFMICNLGSKSAGQFFTPYHISEFMACARIYIQAAALRAAVYGRTSQTDEPTEKYEKRSAAAGRSPLNRLANRPVFPPRGFPFYTRILILTSIRSTLRRLPLPAFLLPAPAYL